MPARPQGRYLLTRVHARTEVQAWDGVKGLLASNEGTSPQDREHDAFWLAFRNKLPLQLCKHQ